MSISLNNFSGFVLAVDKILISKVNSLTASRFPKCGWPKGPGNEKKTILCKSTFHPWNVRKSEVGIMGEPIASLPKCCC